MIMLITIIITGVKIVISLAFFKTHFEFDKCFFCLSVSDRALLGSIVGKKWGSGNLCKETLIANCLGFAQQLCHNPHLTLTALLGLRWNILHWDVVSQGAELCWTCSGQWMALSLWTNCTSKHNERFQSVLLHLVLHQILHCTLAQTAFCNVNRYWYAMPVMEHSASQRWYR